ncbi:MAG: hypothetical protein A2Z99_09185 [Treponema sp. GWB1_62_6]|nr:MAG: hypothetical protein A2Y36_09760 [Treponema sp. GWA1_62_8]OHE69783.1 MAG: hypothetical protein A2001_12230 [Treponema sp. GWC1_61_84]OHE71975.1 MAG: hypothetical protein A2Z99_09185 [Treponema sp. GWB1_62_6]OHE74837.1 MAG: hypothetical protein A2413_13010 [Treponema sp. RIFOXYC1_FULL_61_9]
MKKSHSLLFVGLALLAVSAWAAPVEISYMAWYNNTESEGQDVQNQIDIFNAQYEGKIKVKLVMVPREGYEAKTNTMAAANKLPDATLLSEAMALDFASAGLLADVSSMYPKGEEPLKSLAFTFKGKPVAFSSANEVLLTYYNKKLFDKAGVPYPPASAENAWTWAQFLDAAKKLTIDKNGKNAAQAGFDYKNIVQYGCDFNREWWMWPIACYSNGGGLMSQDGKQLLINKPESLEAFQAIADLYSKHHVAPSRGDLRSMGSIDVNLLTGKVAMATSGQWEIGVSLKNSVPEGLDYGVGVLPKFKKALTYNTGAPYGIFKSSKHLGEAMTFIRWYASSTYPDGTFKPITLDGITMPFLAKYYASDKAMRSWADPAVTKTARPPFDQYKTAVIDYAANNAIQVPWYYFPGYNGFNDILSSGIEAVWNGEVTAKDYIAKIMPKLQTYFDAHKNK